MTGLSFYMFSLQYELLVAIVWSRDLQNNCSKGLNA